MNRSRLRNISLNTKGEIDRTRDSDIDNSYPKKLSPRIVNTK